MLKDKLLSPKICIGILAVAFVYGLVLPFMWGNNPALPTGTLSLLCEDRKLWFLLWGTLMSGSVILNTQYLYKKYEYKNRFFDALCVLAFISMIGVTVTLGHSIEDWNPKRITHWVMTGMFIVFTLLPIALFFLLNVKNRKDFIFPTVCVFLIFMTFVVIFVFIGKSALMEMIPLALLQIFLFYLNFMKKTGNKEKEYSVT